MKRTAVIVFIYGFLIGLGGLLGFVKGGSLVSLISGGSFGLALLLTAYFILKGKRSAHIFALVLTFLLDGVFTFRFTKTLHFFPSGALSLLSLIVLIILALQARKKASGQVS